MNGTLVRRDFCRTGFTLMELVVVVAILGILAAILLPATQSVREASRRTKCGNNLRQVGLGVLNFESALDHLPAGVSGGEANFGSTWLAGILEYVEQSAVGQQRDRDYATYPTAFDWHSGFRVIIPLYQCPSDPSSGRTQLTHDDLIVSTTNYIGVCGRNYQTRDGVLYENSNVRLADVSDGQSNTLLAGERPASKDFWYGWWYAGLGQTGSGSCDAFLGVNELVADGAPYLTACEPGPYQYERGRNEQCDTLHFWSHHPGGAMFVRCDGSTSIVNYSAADIMPQMSTRNGGD